MDALVITLLVTLPLIGVCVVVWLWSRRSPAVKAWLRAGLVVLCLVWVSISALGFLSSRSQWFGSLLGISVIAFANESGALLNEVELVMRVSEQDHRTYQFRPFRAGRRERFSFRASQVFLERVTCVRGSERLCTTNPGVAAPGRILIVRLDPTGRFTSSTR